MTMDPMPYWRSSWYSSIWMAHVLEIVFHGCKDVRLVLCFPNPNVLMDVRIIIV
jgi:hypothetical protein